MPVFQSEQKSINDAIVELAANKMSVKTTAEDDVTLTVGEFINGVYIQSGTPGTSSKTTPTAAAIVAAIRGCQVGSSFDFIIDNGGDDTLTLVAGDSVTLSGTATVAAAKNRMFRGVVTNVATPAVRVMCLAALA